jgi:hypothetical protein
MEVPEVVTNWAKKVLLSAVRSRIRVILHGNNVKKQQHAAKLDVKSVLKELSLSTLLSA